MCFMQQGVKCIEVWHIMWLFAGTLIWYHTHTYTQYTQGAVEWQTHTNIYLHHLLYAHSSCLPYLEWIIHWYKKCTSTMSFIVKNYSLVKVIYLLIRCYKTRFFLWNTNNADRNGVNKQHTYTHQTLRER